MNINIKIEVRSMINSTMKINITNKKIKIKEDDEPKKIIKVDKQLKENVIDELKKLKPDMKKFTRLYLNNKWRKDNSKYWMIGGEYQYIYGTIGVFSIIYFSTSYNIEELNNFESKLSEILSQLNI